MSIDRSDTSSPSSRPAESTRPGEPDRPADRPREAPPKEQVERVLWNRSYLSLPPELRQQYGGWKDFRLWWCLFIIAVLAIYGFFLWFDVWRVD